MRRNRNETEGNRRIETVRKVKKYRISERILKALLRRELITYEAVETELDHHLIKMAWAYDFNFIPSIQILKKRAYIGSKKKILPDSEAIHTAFAQIDAHLDRRLLAEESC